MTLAVGDHVRVLGPDPIVYRIVRRIEHERGTFYTVKVGGNSVVFSENQLEKVSSE